MPKAYTNRKGKTYYIRQRMTKTGKKSYVMTLKESEECVNRVPKGYEVHEIPASAQMVIRKKLPMEYDLKELHLIKSVLKQNKSIVDFKLDTRGKEIVIHAAEVKESSFLSQFGNFSGQEIKGLMTNYEAAMKLIKTGNESNEYAIQRYCYRGSVEDWITIGMSSDLKKMLEKYTYHIGKESYYELGYNFGE